MIDYVKKEMSDLAIEMLRHQGFRIKKTRNEVIAIGMTSKFVMKPEQAIIYCNGQAQSLEGFIHSHEA